jgi:formate C-acetyltransferase
MALSKRIERFHVASRARAEKATGTLRQVNFEKALLDRYANRPRWERHARSMAYALENEPVHLLPDEQLVGILYQGASPSRGRTMAPGAEGHDAGRQARRRIAELDDTYGVTGGAPAHIGWRWDRVLRDGVDGIMDEIRQHLAATSDVEAKRLYRGALILWRAVLHWNAKHVAALRNAASSASGEAKKRLGQLIRICDRVPRRPARTFHEAVQAFHMQHLAVMFENPFGGNSPGRVDAFLWPYLERDLAAGTISKEEAKDLIDELFIRFEERLWERDGWVEAIVPGGTKPDGSCAVNPLSHMMVQSIAALNQTHPVVYPRLSGDSPESFVELCVNYLLHGRNRAQIYNDDACIPAIVKSGTPEDEAADYMAGGCMEVSVQGRACDLNFARTHNVAKTLELVLNGGCDLRTGVRLIPLSRTLPDFITFEALYAAFEKQLQYEYGQMVRGLDIQSECFAEYRPTFLLSSLIDDCLDRGRDQQDGGARYHEYGFSALGVTTASDSLNALKRAVYDQGLVAADELLEAMRADFAGHEATRLRLCSIPKYGVEDPEADAMCDRVMRSVCAISRRQKVRFGGQLKPMIFNFTWTPGASAALGARADGSHAGDMIGHGITPQKSAMVKGVTAAMNSCTALDVSVVSGGATTMWDMDQTWINFDRMKALLRRFFGGGGMIFQGNTTSVAELEDALVRPEAHPDLIVRVGGYSARFTGLDSALQQEVITRHRHATA